MMNIRELSSGSYVTVKIGVLRYFVQVVEILRDARVSVIWLEPVYDGEDYVLGKIYTFPLEQLHGISLSQLDMERFGFTEGDEKGWQKVYWFGLDMKLLYRYDKKRSLGRFRFKTDYRKSYVSIGCHYFHQLQNIMRFLTGGELEFEFKAIDK